MSTDLRGLTVAVTASRRANELAHLIAIHGASPYIASTVGIDSSGSKDAEAEGFCRALHEGQVDFVVFMTGPGVFSLFTAARGLQLEGALKEDLSKTRVVARSAKPKDALAKHGIRVDAVPADATSEGILDLLRGTVRDKTVLVLSHGSEPFHLVEGLKELGAEVHEFSTYSYTLETSSSGAELLGSMRFSPVMPTEASVVKLIDEVLDGKIDMITFTSPPSANNLFAIASSGGRDAALRSVLNSSVIVVAVGPPTRESIEKNGVLVDVMPSVYKMGPMVKEACDYVRTRGPKRAAQRQTQPAEGH